jgi:hypothetical protein
MDILDDKVVTSSADHGIRVYSLYVYLLNNIFKNCFLEKMENALEIFTQKNLDILIG